MTGVKHMKWWGWGVEGVAFNPDNKPKLAPFVLKAVGLDLLASAPKPPITFDELDVPDSQLPEALRSSLTEAVGETYVITEDMDRVVHTYGKSLRDLLRIRANILGSPMSWSIRLTRTRSARWSTPPRPLTPS